MYRGSAGFVINEQLRTGEMSMHLRPIVDALRAAIGRARLDAPARVWRGVGPGSRVGQARVGDIIADEGFMSASIDEAMAAEMGELVMELDLPAGTQAAYINRIPRLSAAPDMRCCWRPAGGSESSGGRATA